MVPQSKPKIVFIVDNDSVDNLIFKFLVRRFQQRLNIIELDCGRKALDKLQHLAETDPQNLPDYLFLASETPTMNCWQFLKEFEKLKVRENHDMSIYILSSLLQNDVKKHEQDNLINGFINKPLNPKNVEKIFDFQSNL